MKTKLITLIALLTLSLNTYAQTQDVEVACSEEQRLQFQGNFVNPEYNDQFNNAFVKFEAPANKTDRIQVTLSIPCKSKVIASQFQLACLANSLPTLLLISQGSSQCSLGDRIRVSLSRQGSVLKIHTDILVPGFNGRYTFSKDEVSHEQN